MNWGLAFALHVVVNIAFALLAYCMGWRTGRRLLLKATVDYVTKQPVPRRNYEERMLDYAKLQQPDQTRIVW